MKVAIIGCGLAGLGVAYHLKKMRDDLQITFFDQNGIGGAASSIATGLVHPYVGRQGRLSFEGFEAFAITHAMILDVQKLVSYPIYDPAPIIKLAIGEDHMLAKQKGITQIDSTSYQIEQSLTLYTKSYMEALFHSLDSAKIFKQTIRDLEQLDDYDRVIIAGGYDSIDWLKDFGVELSATKGQVLMARHSISNSTLANGYLAKTQDPTVICVGSTYEREAFNYVPQQEKAKRLIKERMSRYIPEFNDFAFIDCKAAVRVRAKEGYLPIIKQITNRLFIYSGLGSRGLLYHGHFGKKLAKTICFAQNVSL